MITTPLAVDGAVQFDPMVHGDERGTFAEVFTESSFQAAVPGVQMRMAQVNVSTSRYGVLRGIHFSPLQAKYVTCASGYVIDYVVDVRPWSKTFMVWDKVHLCGNRAVYIPPGVGHAFCAVSDMAVVSYVCSYPYDPTIEYTVYPKDPELGIEWPVRSPIMSARDLAAPTLSEFLHEKGDSVAGWRS